MIDRKSFPSLLIISTLASGRWIWVDDNMGSNSHMINAYKSFGGNNSLYGELVQKQQGKKQHHSIFLTLLFRSLEIEWNNIIQLWRHYPDWQ